MFSQVNNSYERCLLLTEKAFLSFKAFDQTPRYFLMEISIIKAQDTCDTRLTVGWWRQAIRGAERSLVRVLLSLTPLRIATSMFPSSCSSASSPVPWYGWTSWLGRGTVGGLVEAWPLQDVKGIVPASSALTNVEEYELSSPPPISSELLLPLTVPDISGTVGIFTGTTGVRMGMGPPPTEPERRAQGLEEGVRRIVATPGVTITEPWPAGRITEVGWILGK